MLIHGNPKSVLLESLTHTFSFVPPLFTALLNKRPAGYGHVPKGVPCSSHPTLPGY